mmetsp:Transcript_22103/g.30832  ORF Transcript_22103/g.30832 Transcript_22103/m.30832 type:complete len:170 (-) Transcript_22103:378-887(-)
MGKSTKAHRNPNEAAARKVVESLFGSSACTTMIGKVGKRFDPDAGVDELFQALEDTTFTKEIAMQLSRTTKNIHAPGHRASQTRTSKHPEALFYRKAVSEALQISQTTFSLREGKSSVHCSVLHVKWARVWPFFATVHSPHLVDPENGIRDLNVNIQQLRGNGKLSMRS